jgi:hypothetical protein
MRGGCAWEYSPNLRVIPEEYAKKAADALEAKDALIAQLVEAIRPFANDPSDWEVEWVDKARVALSKAQSSPPESNE